MKLCPGCAQPMKNKSFSRKPHGNVELDLCFTCHGIWFDQYESATLTPGSVMQLFREIHEHHDKPPRPIPARMGCPTCRTGLALTHDVQRTNRISYYRCPNGDGRFTTFFQFLREKNFVRSLSGAEITQLRATISQVRCSSCGAPVELGAKSVCGYCSAPVSILDADSVKKTLAELSAAERKSQHYDPTAAVDAALAGKRVERNINRIERQSRASGIAGPTWVDGVDLVDLVSDALDFLMSD